jgi:hypothetical protein
MQPDHHAVLLPEFNVVAINQVAGPLDCGLIAFADSGSQKGVFRQAAAAASSFSPVATILSAPSDNGCCNLAASSQVARIQTSHASPVVGMTGIAVGCTRWKSTRKFWPIRKAPPTKRPPTEAPSIQALAEFLDDLPQVACVLFDESPCILQA